MTTLGQLANFTMVASGPVDPQLYSVMTGLPAPFDLDSVVRHVEQVATGLQASIGGTSLGNPSSIRAAITGWINQDDDAHDMCSLVACRTPLHPGPCKGWKGTLHAVSPHIWKQIEQERVDKANARRTKKIAELKAQGKPIPRRLLTEIKPKPAPASGASGGHPANGATPTPLGKVNQQADLTGGQAHAASQAINKAAGVTPNTATLPKGPKGKKPSVAGRGPAFVITQPKVTDTYKLDKASKLTPQEWASLSTADQKAIRDELEAIKQRGFGPQQTKADQLLAKLQPSPTLAATKAAPVVPKIGVPHPQRPAATPGKATLGQAVKTVHAPASPPVAAATSAKQADAAVGIAEAIFGKQAIDASKLATAFDDMKAKSASGEMDQRQGFKLLVDKLANAALKRADADRMPGLGHGPNDVGIADFNHQIRDHILDGKPGLPPVVQKMKDHHDAVKAGNATPAPAPSAPSSTPTAPKIGVPGAPTSPPKAAPASPPSTPAVPKVLSPDAQQARAIAGRAVGGRPTAKLHLDAYGKLSKADFDNLDATTQKTIRDDLGNASAKFLDPKKKQAARDLLDRFGSRHPAPANGKSNAPSGPPPSPAPSNAPAPHPKGYSDPQVQAVKSASSGTASTGDVLRDVARLSPKQVNDLDDADKKAITHRLAFIATHPKATDVQKQQAAAYGRIIVSGSPVQKQPADHTVSIGEIHRTEQTTGLAVKQAALDATAITNLSTADRIKALAGLTKAQLDALPADERRKILDALQDLTSTGDPKVNAAAAEAMVKYTGVHPGVHRVKTAEVDFRAGKITGDQLFSEYISAVAATPANKNKAARDALNAEATRIARDNPNLPMYARVRLVGENKYGLPTYNAISMADMKHSWDPAPRLSRYDLKYLFDPTDDDLKAVDPIHAQAIRDLREHVLLTGLRGKPGQPGGSPWSTSTRGEAARAFLGPDANGEIPRDRLARFHAASPAVQMLVRSAISEDMRGRSNNYSKTEAWITLRELEGWPQLLGEVRDAVLSAADRLGSPQGKMDAYRRLPPAEFRNLPDFTRQAIQTDLEGAQRQAEGFGAVESWGHADNALKKFPVALMAHLEGSRQVAGMSREERNVHDIANYGRKIILPADRVAAYNKLAPLQLQALPGTTHIDTMVDLKKIEEDASLPLQTRYDAAMNGQVFLRTNSQISLNPQQLSAVQAADLHPSSMYSDTSAASSFNYMSKADYDGLSPAFRAAVDERIKALPGSDQQMLNARFRPQAAAATPAGVVPTQATGPVPAHVQEALDTLYGVHPKAHTMAHQLKTYGGLRGSDFNAFNPQEQQQLLSDLSFIATTAKGPSADKAKKLIDRFTPAGTPSGQLPGNPAIIPPANSVPGQTRYAVPLKGLAKAKDSGKSGDGWLTLPGGKRVWGHYGAAGLLVKHTDPNTGEERYLMVQRGPAISDPGKWTFPGGASDSKETPHEGATRETIEELGLKDDQFKDALVHGDHVFSVPGSTWKYTTVAASVPTMFKPDLSSHHARLETSDAKWMTLAEIRALDSSGKLHGPIAGGLLEKNVISLYPQGGSAAGTLGQIARPGPVTKRPNRLTMPAGGRQSPATFNAWSKPHKPSTGKNLVSDKAAISAMRQKVKNDAKLYDGKTADSRLAAIGAMQGFDDTPTVVSKAEIDKLLATGDYIEAWRGVSGAGGWSARSRGGAGGKTASDINEEMRTGPAYYGRGIFGNGYYLATQKRVAEQYSDHTRGSLVRVLIPKSAMIEKYDKVEREAQANSTRYSKNTAPTRGTDSYSTFWDPGRWGAAKGLDGIEINPHHRAHGGGGAGHVASTGKPAFNWLNRSVLIVQKEPG